MTLKYSDIFFQVLLEVWSCVNVIAERTSATLEVG